MSQTKRNTLLLFALSVVLAFSFQGSRGLFGPDEGRYAECGREMFDSGDWLVPTLGGELHFSKPPLTYWSIAAGLAAFGVNEWGARMYLAVAFVATILIVARFGAMLWDERTGWWCGFIYMTMLLPFVSANIATTDTLLTLWETLALYCLWRGLTQSPSRAGRWGWVAAGWAALGAAFLTKGPPGMFPVLIMALFIAIQRGRPRLRLFAALFNPLALLAFVLIAAPWFVAVCRKFPDLLHYFLGSEVRDRILTDKHERHGEWYEAFKIYVPAMLAGTLPWSLLWLTALWKKWRKRGKEQQPGAPARPAMRDDPPRLLIAIWITAMLIIFSLAQSRMILYVLPILPATALGTARLWIGMTGISRREDGSYMGARWMCWAAAALFIFLLGGKAASGFVNSTKDLHNYWKLIKDDVERYNAVLYVEKNEAGVGFYYDGPTSLFIRRPRDVSNFIKAQKFDYQRLKDNPDGVVFAMLLDDDDAEDFEEEARWLGVPMKIRELINERFLILCNLPENAESE